MEIAVGEAVIQGLLIFLGRADECRVWTVSRQGWGAPIVTPPRTKIGVAMVG